jgi:uncharacterized lipoprotein YmbA
MRVLTAFVVSVALLGCASPPPQQKSYYLLRDLAAQPEGAERSDARVGIGRVVAAAYLDHLGLALETAPNEVRAARNHLWSEPLEHGLLIYLRGAVSSALGEPVAYRSEGAGRWEQVVEVYVEQLHGTMTGSAVIVAGYQLLGPGDAFSEYRFGQSAELDGEGYGALVAAEKRLLSALGEAIAESIRASR